MALRGDRRAIKRRRKLKPTHVERTVFGDGDGSDLFVADTALGKIGQLSCREHLQPLSKYAMCAQNEQVHCAAWPNLALYEGGAHALGHQVNNAASMIYAVEGDCYVIAACALVAKPQQDILIDLGMIALAKAAADPAGHYARRDVTRFLLNTRRQRPVLHFDDADGVTVAAEAPEKPGLASVEAAE